MQGMRNLRIGGPKLTTLFSITGIILAEEGMTARVFGLDAQLLMDAVIMMCAVFFLFLMLSYLVFNPARDLLKKRQQKVADDLTEAQKEKADALEFKKEYEAKLSDADKEAGRIIAEGRHRAMEHEERIVEQAKEEAARVMARNEKEIELEKERAKDEVRRNMIDVAEVMAGKFVAEKMDENKQNELIDEALNEMGNKTWQQ